MDKPATQENSSQAKEQKLASLIEQFKILEEKYKEINRKIEILELEEKNSDFSNTFEIESSESEPYQVNVDNLVNKLINDAGEEKIKEDIQSESNSKKIIDVSEYLRFQTTQDLNKNWLSEKTKTVKEWVKRKFKRTLMALLVVGNFSATTSFSYKYDDKALAYDKLKVENLDDWNNIKLYEEEINKLDNISIINEGQKDEEGKYLIVDKNMAMAHLYEKDSLISSYEVGTGLKKGDTQTQTVIKDGNVYWAEGNMQTGAGIYKINNQNTFNGAPSFTLCNERGIEVPTVLHKTSLNREKYFGDGNTENNRMTNGCINFHANDIENLVEQGGLERGAKVYILPDDPHNKFVFVNNEVRFVSNEKDVNKTIRPYNPQPIILKAEKANEEGKTFLQTLSENKHELMNLYPGVPNSVYNELTKVAYGIFGQESSFGTYGGPRGQLGRITDKVGAIAGKNISAGVTQIRISSINPKVQEFFKISTPSDLFDVSKSSIATMSLLLDIYTNNIPKNQKDNYRELTALHYNNPKEFKNVIKNKQKKIDNGYVKKVMKYSKNVKVYVSNYK